MCYQPTLWGPEAVGVGWASHLYKDVTSSCSGSPFPWQQLHPPRSLRNGQGQRRAPLPAHPLRVQLEPHSASQCLDPESQVSPGVFLALFQRQLARSPQPPTPNQKTPGKTSPPKSCNTAGFMLLFQVLTPWNRVEGEEKLSFRNRYKQQEAQRRRHQNRV